MTVSHLLPEVYAFVIENKHIELTTNTAHHVNSYNHVHTDSSYQLSTDNTSHNHDHSAMKTIGLFIMLGIVFQIVLEYFSKGAEHGHVHLHEKMTQLPWLLFASLCLHALFEGMPISQHHHLAWAIAVHHFPIAIILTLFLQAQLSKNLSLFSC